MVEKIKKLLEYGCLCAAVLFIYGCETGQRIQSEFEPPVYPPPPEEPRFIYEQTLKNSVQLTTDAKRSAMRHMLTGEVASGNSFSKPFDVAVCQGRVYVSDSVQRIVHAFDYPQKRYYEIGEKEPGLLIKPLGLATDDNCNLYVADGSQNRIVIYNQDGGFLSAIGGSKWFTRLSHIAVDGEGEKLFAVDTGNVESEGHRIRVFKVDGGGHLYDIGERGAEEGQLNLPRDLSIGTNGNLYIVDGGNFRIQEFTRAGEFVSTFGVAGSRFGQFSRPKGIAVDPTGNIYVSDASFGNFQIFNPEGRLLLYVGSRSNRDGPGMYLLPAGIDVDEDGRIYFVGQFFRKLDIFRPATLEKEMGFLGAFYVN